jgi:hypothetical protein
MMKSEKLPPLWSAISVAAAAVLAGVLSGYVLLVIVG